MSSSKQVKLPLQNMHERSTSKLKIEVHNSVKEFHFADTYQEQDRLIQDGIALLCDKVAECLDQLFHEHRKSDQDACCQMSREWQIKHHGWQDKFFELHGRLSAWELQHCKAQTFSLAFESLITYLSMEKAVK